MQSALEHRWMRLTWWALLSFLWAQPYKDLEVQGGAVYALVFSSDSRYLLSAGSDRMVRLWHIPHGTLLARFGGSSASVNALGLLPDSGGTFWGVSSDGKLYQWRIADYRKAGGSIIKPVRTQALGKRVQKGGPPDPWESVAIDFRKQLLYVVSRGGLLVAWDTEEDWLQTFQDTARVAYALALSSQKKALYLGSGSGALLVLDPQSLSLQKTLRGHTKGIRGLAISPDERILASAGLDGKVMLWSIPEGLRIKTLEKHTDGVRAVAFSPDGRYLASAGKDGLLCLWALPTGRLEKTIELGVPLWTVAFSPNGQYLVVGGDGGMLRLWRIDQLGIRPIQIIAESDSLYAPPLDLQDNVPQCKAPQPHRYAFIIGNEDYQSYQPTFTPAMNVPYAIRDAYAFRVYAEQILGVPALNIVFLQNATSAQIQRELEKLFLLIAATRGKAEIFFYYAGHGVPHPQTQESYILPVDVSPNAPEKGGIRLTDLVQQLGSSGAEKVWIILDACFSGGAREESPLAARGIRLRPKPVVLTGPVVLISATSAEEEALPYHQARHGLFTYFFLKALKLKGCTSTSIQTLLEEAATETTRYALLLHHKLQRPTWMVSPALSESVLAVPW
ncbi:MAG: caspase family protein [Bacteroidia bacterium]|nr:caspase family protein [Bacteroidia bacterium]MCX7763787.1 caspase family protein [Bacteroidia bacterium]